MEIQFNPHDKSQTIDWCTIEALKPCFHEAGHAVVSRLTGFPVAWVSIDESFIRNGEPVGHNGDGQVCMTIASDRINPILNSRSAPNKEQKETLIGYCLEVLAGPFVEQRIDPEGFNPWLSANDYAQMNFVLDKAVANREIRKKLKKTAIRRLERMLDDNWPTIVYVADALNRQKTLFEADLDAIIFADEPHQIAA